MATTVHIEGISSKTNEQEVKNFFSFCGKIQSINVTPKGDDTQSATVTFEKAAAAKTALLLDNTQLGPNQVRVTSEQSLDEPAGDKPDSSTKEGDDHLEQEDKPRSRIIAEYLAQGYVISDKAIERALALDQQHGVSAKFTQALQNFDSRFHASEKAQAVDNKFGVTDKLAAAWSGFTSYFDKAAETPTGQKLRQFYTTGNKTVVDVHNEARHLADMKKKDQGGEGKSSAEEAGVEQVPGTDKTKCNCHSETGKCACPEGKCACAGCGKAEKSGNADSYAAAAST